MPSTKIINVLKDDSFDEILELFKETPAPEVIFVLPKKGKLFSKEQHFVVLASHAEVLGKKILLLCSNPDINAMGRQYGFSILAGKKPSDNEETARLAVSVELSGKPVAINASSVPPQDSAIHDDTIDAFEDEDSIMIPSDEKIAIEHGEEDEIQEGMHIVGPEGENEKAPEEDLGDEEAPGDELDALEKEEEAQSAEGTLAPLQQGRDFEIVAAVKSDRGLDGFVRSDAEERRNLKISKKEDRSVLLNVHRSRPVPKKGAMDDIERVWRRESSEDESLWSKVAKKKGGGALFKKIGSWSWRPGGWSKKIVPVLLALSVVILGSILFVTFGNAKIFIKPVEKSLETKLTLDVSEVFTAPDPVFNKLPGQLFNIEKTVTQTFPATGQKEVAQKARGKIVISNIYGTAPQVLIATTRFESPNGLIFRTLSTISVPGTKVVNGQVIAGTVTADVVADKPGNNYNINAAKFTIPAFKERGDQDRYGKFYGESSQAFSGGASGLAKVVTDADYAKASDAVTASLFKDISESLKSETAGLKIADAASVSAPAITTTAKPDQAADTFTVTATGRIKTIGFKESDLWKLIAAYADKNGELTVLPERLKLEYGTAKFVESKNVFQMTVSVSGPAYAKIDSKKIISDLAGKSEKNLRDYIKKDSNVASARVILSPFWLQKIPKDQAKIGLEVVY